MQDSPHLGEAQQKILQAKLDGSLSVADMFREPVKN